jgi:hypothetical protein
MICMKVMKRTPARPPPKKYTSSYRDSKFVITQVWIRK